MSPFNDYRKIGDMQLFRMDEYEYGCFHGFRVAVSANPIPLNLRLLFEGAIIRLVYGNGDLVTGNGLRVDSGLFHYLAGETFVPKYRVDQTGTTAPRYNKYYFPYCDSEIGLLKITRVCFNRISGQL